MGGIQEFKVKTNFCMYAHVRHRLNTSNLYIYFINKLFNLGIKCNINFKQYTVQNIKLSRMQLKKKNMHKLSNDSSGIYYETNISNFHFILQE